MFLNHHLILPSSPSPTPLRRPHQAEPASQTAITGDESEAHASATNNLRDEMDGSHLLVSFRQTAIMV